MMGTVRAQVVFQGKSNLPEDRFVNTLHFQNGAPYDDHIDDIGPALIALWTQVVDLGDGMSFAMNRFLSDYVMRVAEVRTYDLTLPEGQRAPTIFPFDLGVAISQSALPEEVACVVSFGGGVPIRPRTRGRNYIGPLSIAAMGPVDPTQSAKVNLTMRQVILGAYTRLGNDFSLGWGVRSEGARVPRANVDAPLGALLPVIFTTVSTVWLDDAFDTQRRRGGAPTSRISASVGGP